jgi:hypothetical protein
MPWLETDPMDQRTAFIADHQRVLARGQHRSHQHPGVVAPTTAAPNDRWTADFKG